MAKTAKMETAEMRYLLGELSKDAETRIEEAFFADDSKFEAIELAEDELTDAYVRNELSSEDMRRFEAKLLLSPRLLERVKFASALVEKADSFQAQDATAPFAQAPTSEVEARWWRGFFGNQPRFGMAMAACVLLVLVAGALLISGWLRLRGEAARLANERASLQRQKEELDKQSAAERRKIDDENAQLQRERDDRAKEAKLVEDQNINKRNETTNRQSSANTFAMVLLLSGSVRSGDSDTPELVIGPETTTGQLRIRLEKNQYRAYKAIIKTPEDNEVFRQSRLTPQSIRSGPPLLIISVPIRHLPPNDYTVQVEGITASGLTHPLFEYPFRVRKS